MVFLRRRRSARSLDLTPLIDVVFQLLIFFLLTSVFAEAGIPLRLPEASTGQAPDGEGLVISIAPDGHIQVGEEWVALEALPERLAREEKRRVLVRGDVAARYGVFVRVVDACRSAGLGDVTLASQRADDDGAP